MAGNTFTGNPYVATTIPQMAVGEYFWLKDRDGLSLWRQCYAQEDLVFGGVLKDSVDLVNGGTITTAGTTSTRLLVDTGNFTLARDVYIGAWGQTLGTHANGGGQIFYVTDKVDDDTLEVFVMYSSTAAGVGSRNDDGNWVAATVDSTTTYDLAKPGRVELATDGVAPSGVCLVNGGVDQSDKPYFVAKCSGLAPCLVDDSDNNIIPGDWVTVSPSTDGRIEGPNAAVTPTATEIAGFVGKALFDEISFDSMALVDLIGIAQHAQSQHLIRTQHPLNVGTISA